MIWRIFRKDWKLLWPVAVGVASINIFLRLLLLRIGLFPGFRVGSLVNLLSVGGLLGTAILIVLAVQQDPLPGVRQDWLARPIRRTDLLLSKVLFMALVAQAPIFGAEVIQGLAAGFSIGQSIGAPLARNLWLIFMFDLPIVAFAALTRNLMEGVVSGLICFLAGAVVIGLINVFAVPQATMDTGIQWITYSVMALLGSLSAAAILFIQYRLRKTIAARWMFACAGIVWLALLLTPWRPAFAIEQRLSPAPGAASSVSIRFNPGAGEFHPPPGTELQDSSSRRFSDVPNSRIYLPVQVAGVSPDATLLVDDARVHLVAAGGRGIVAPGGGLEMNRDGAAYEAVQIPVTWLMTHENNPVRVEIDYSLTLAALTAAHSMAAAKGELRTSDLGWCQSRVNDTDTAIQVRCMKPGKQPDSLVFTLENAAAGLANPQRVVYTPDYSLYFQTFMPDSMGRRGATLPFRDPSGVAHYPVDGSQLAGARIVIKTYSAHDHFTRKLSVENVRLADWSYKAR